MNTENVTILYNFDALKNKDAIDRELAIWKRYPKNLLSIENDAKTVKGGKHGVLTGVLYEAPADVASVVTLCPMAELAGCLDTCIYYTGKGRFSSTQQSRIRRTLFIDQYPALAHAELVRNIEALKRKAKREDKRPAVRLKGTSDRDFDKWCAKHGLPNIFEMFPDVMFYDYSKIAGREQHPNHHVTLSYSARPEYQRHAKKLLATGQNVAVAFHGKTLPDTFAGRRVIDGDKTDVRFFDDENVIVGLKFKRSGNKDVHGFGVSQ